MGTTTYARLARSRQLQLLDLPLMRELHWQPVARVAGQAVEVLLDDGKHWPWYALWVPHYVHSVNRVADEDRTKQRIVQSVVFQVDM